jgi:high affinity Mn2+ porin
MDCLSDSRPSDAAAYNWNGFYAGVHIGVAWGSSNWTEQPDGLVGSLNLFQRPDAFSEFGSWFGGVQAGYDYMLPNRLVVGVAADVSAPSFQNLNGLSIGGSSTFVSPTLGQESLSETVLDMGTVLFTQPPRAPGQGQVVPASSADQTSD